MATLTGQQIDASYLGLLKTEDNGIIGAVAKGITDGQGGVTNMTIGTTSTNFYRINSKWITCSCSRISFRYRN